MIELAFVAAVMAVTGSVAVPVYNEIDQKVTTEAAKKIVAKLHPS